MSQAEDIRNAIRSAFPPHSIVTREQIISAVQKLYPAIATGSIMPSDHCFHGGKSPATGRYPVLKKLASGKYMTLPPWQTFQFAKPVMAVYVFCMHLSSETIPFYIGQTKKFRRRMGEYSLASFQAPTDFAVGSAIQYLQEQEIDVIVFHMDTDSVPTKEKYLIKRCNELGIKLLNSIPRYKYQSASRQAEIQKVSAFINSIIQQAQPDTKYLKDCSRFAKEFGF